MYRGRPLPLCTVLLAAGLLLLSGGCGTIEEGTEGESDTWAQPTDLPPDPPQDAPGMTDTPPPVEPPELLLLQYRVDSLQGENRRLRQQVEAMAAELRTVSARNTDLEQRLAAAAAPVRSSPPPVQPAPQRPAPAAARTPSPSPAEPQRSTRKSVRAPSAPPSSESSDAYSDALATYRRRNFQEAAGRFEAILKGGKAGSLTPNCHYWLGESFYGMGKYEAAADQFREVLAYPTSEKKDDAQMMLGNSYLGLRNPAAAKEAFAVLIREYPRSPFVRRAQEKMSGIE